MKKTLWNVCAVARYRSLSEWSMIKPLICVLLYKGPASTLVHIPLLPLLPTHPSSPPHFPERIWHRACQFSTGSHDPLPKSESSSAKNLAIHRTSSLWAQKYRQNRTQLNSAKSLPSCLPACLPAREAKEKITYFKRREKKGERKSTYLRGRVRERAFTLERKKKRALILKIEGKGEGRRVKEKGRRERIKACFLACFSKINKRFEL